MCRRLAFLVLVAAALGCTGVDDDLMLAPALVGGASETEPVVTVSGTSLAGAEFTLETGQSMTLGQAPLRHGPSIHFAPREPGLHYGVLVAALPHRTLRLRVLAEAVARDGCPVADVCEVPAVDPVTGDCIVTAAPLGTPCQERCVVAGRCREGRCEGRPRNCDDGDACTTDACDPENGCVHHPVPRPPADSCESTDRCSPVRGWSWKDDSAACGPVSCASRGRCLAGRCIQTLPPAPACAPPDTVPIDAQEAWRRDFDGTVTGLALADDGEALFYRCDPLPPGAPWRTPATCELLAVDVEGTARTLAPVLGALGDPMLIDDDVIVTADAEVLRLHRTNGAVVWRSSMDGKKLSYFAHMQPGTVRFDETSLSFEYVAFPDCTACDVESLQGLVSVADGTVSSAPLSTWWWPVQRASDGHGQLVTLRTWYTGNDDMALQASGRRTWHLELPMRGGGAWDLALAPDLAVVGGMRAASVEDGNAPFDLWAGSPGSVVWTGDVAWQVLPGPCESADVMAFERSTGAVRGRCEIALSTVPGRERVFGDPIATSDGTVLVAMVRQDDILVDEIDGAGTFRRRFRLSFQVPPGELPTIALGANRLVVEASTGLASFHADGLKPAVSGWITRHGNFARTGTPR